jgi:hypothetical protein
MKSLLEHSEVFKESERFRTLGVYGKFISFLGWLLFGVSIIVGIIGFAGIPKGQSLLYLFAGIAGVLLGFVWVASGQVISCFISIEKNTRTTSEILQSSQGKTT